MSLSVCLGAYTLRYPGGGAYAWMFLNWALGLQSLGCRVIWLDSVRPEPERDAADIPGLRERLERYGLDDLVVIQPSGAELSPEHAGSIELEEAAGADLFLNLGYDLGAGVVRRFRRSAFVDIDPGLTQLWMHLGQLNVARHDVYFTLGESVGRSGSRIPTAGIDWVYTPPPVFLPAWAPGVIGAPRGEDRRDAAYTTVSNWWGEVDWLVVDGTVVDNSKRAAFLEYLDLPSRISAPLELALPLDPRSDLTGDAERLERHGWRVRHALDVSGTAEGHQAYVWSSRGEFSCMKRGYALFETAWTGERALNYLASGRPVIVQHTGRSRFLPDAEGLFRFRTVDEAAACLAAAERDWDRHSRAARALAEEHFDAGKVVRAVLERALA
jgi:glycosyltransferase involved in cell wall biosynthesis